VRTKHVNTHFECLVALQNLRAQREVMHRALVIVVNDVTFPVLAPLSSSLCPRLALSLVRGWRARRLRQLYALYDLSRQQSEIYAKRKRGQHILENKLTAWIQNPGSGETMSMRRDCECTLSHVSSGTNILRPNR
jgi:hypothetical protein